MPKIRVVDTETQGLEAERLVCELGWCDVINTGAGWTIGDHGSTLCRVDEMPPQARAIHHIGAAETQGFPPFDAEAMWATAKADGVDVVAAHVWAFDSLRFGPPQLPAICTFKSARQLWSMDAPAHGNGVLRYWLEDAGRIAPEPALTLPPHRAGPDAYVTAHILLAMLSETTASQMVAWTKLPVLMPTCPIGTPWRGMEWPKVDQGFVKWIVDKRQDDPDLVWNARRELDRRAS